MIENIEAVGVVLTQDFTPDALAGMAEFSHVEVLFLIQGVSPSHIVTGSRHPRGTAEWPAVGIFAQRGKNRPHRIGSTICREAVQQPDWSRELMREYWAK